MGRNQDQKKRQTTTTAGKKNPISTKNQQNPEASRNRKIQPHTPKPKPQKNLNSFDQQEPAKKKKAKLDFSILGDARGKGYVQPPITVTPRPNSRVPEHRRKYTQNGGSFQIPTFKPKPHYETKKKQDMGLIRDIITNGTNESYGNHTTTTIRHTTFITSSTMNTPLNGDNVLKFLTQHVLIIFSIVLVAVSVMILLFCARQRISSLSQGISNTSFWRDLSSCCSTPFRWIGRFSRWIRSKLPWNRSSRDGREPTPAPRAFDHSEEVHPLLANNEARSSSQVNLSSELDDILRNMKINSPMGISQKWEFQNDSQLDESLKAFEDSLKPSEEDAKLEKRQQNERIKLQQEIKELRTQMKEMDNKHKSESSSLAGSFDEIDKADQEFRKKLEEQNIIFKEKMRKLKEKREERRREAEEELKQMRYETQQNIAAFLMCIKMKLRFADEEQKWSDSLTSLRKPLTSIISSYHELQNEIKNADHNDQFSMDSVRNEGNWFANKVVNAQKMLALAFDNLKNLIMEFDDRIFIKMIMKSISEQGRICNDIGETLVMVMRSKTPADELVKLNNSVIQLDPHSIPTTSALMKKAPFERHEDYQNPERVPDPNWLRHFK